MQRNTIKIVDNMYYDEEGNRRTNGIYCQIFDRWLMLDDYDYWITLQTAQLLSSKIATTVYVLPKITSGMTNDNCLNYMVFNKTAEKRGAAADLITSQIPTVKVLNDATQLVEVGLPKEFDTGSRYDKLIQLKEYAEYVNRCVYALSLSNTIVNYVDNKTFAEQYLPNDWLNGVTLYRDATKFEDGVIKEVKKQLYMSNSVEEARDNIKGVWEKDYNKVVTLANEYYKFLDEVPNLKIL
jgi:hypothetical protein